MTIIAKSDQQRAYAADLHSDALDVLARARLAADILAQNAGFPVLDEISAALDALTATTDAGRIIATAKGQAPRGSTDAIAALIAIGRASLVSDSKRLPADCVPSGEGWYRPDPDGDPSLWRRDAEPEQAVRAFLRERGYLPR